MTVAAVGHFLVLLSSCVVGAALWRRSHLLPRRDWFPTLAVIGAWAAFAFWDESQAAGLRGWVLGLELPRALGLAYLCIAAIRRGRPRQGAVHAGGLRWRQVGVAAGIALAGGVLWYTPFSTWLADQVRYTGDLRVLVLVLAAVLGLVVVEQFYRNARHEHRWALKFVAIPIGAIFAYDLTLYTQAVISGALSEPLWRARGFFDAAVLPMLVVAARRMDDRAPHFLFSRDLVFHSTALVAVGTYLLAIASIGYYLRLQGGTWSGVLQVLFVAGAAVVLAVLLFSGTARAAMKVYFSKHFFARKYDYRAEWLKLSRALSSNADAHRLAEGAVRLLAELVESRGGALWWSEPEEPEQYRVLCTWCLPQAPTCDRVSAAGDSLIQFLGAQGWVVEVPEFHETPELYAGLDLAPWLQVQPDLWLVVPLMLGERLAGFVCLVTPRIPRAINWEDHDLLKTVGAQLANHIALLQTLDRLSEARQFEAYNRLSAFLVHDLKNLVAQLSLIVSNAEQHRRNPDFVDDAIETLGHVVERMQRLVAQLRQGKWVEHAESVDLLAVVKALCAQMRARHPEPRLVTALDECRVMGDRERMFRVLGHLIQNAQEATPETGDVRVELSIDGSAAVVRVIDSGIGMEREFVQSRLFKPFDTTKGNAGMGIGAYEAEQYVRGLGGSIGVESTPGEGTEFSVFLPLSTDAHPGVDPEAGHGAGGDGERSAAAT